MIHRKTMQNTHKGFTVIELSLSMAFVGVLLITIVIITVNIISIYQKGLSIRSINSTGQDLIDEFSRSIAEAPVKSIKNLCNKFTNEIQNKNCVDDNAHLFIFQQNKIAGSVNLTSTNGNIAGADVKAENPPSHGAFCTGRDSYIWNSGYVLNGSYGHTDKAATIKAKNNAEIKNFRLVRVEGDQDRTVCANHLVSNKYESSNSNTYNIPNINKNNIKELLGLTSQKYTSDDSNVSRFALNNTDKNLALFDFQIFHPTQQAVTLQSYYSGTFILATLQGSVNITTTGDYCTEIPDNLTTDFAYCAINKFNFAARATGELNNAEKAQNQ